MSNSSELSSASHSESLFPFGNAIVVPARKGRDGWSRKCHPAKTGGHRRASVDKYKYQTSVTVRYNTMERTADRLGPSRINHHGFTVGVRSCAPWVFSNEPRLPGPFSVGWFSLSLVGSGCDATRDALSAKLVASSNSTPTTTRGTVLHDLCPAPYCAAEGSAA